MIEFKHGDQHFPDNGVLPDPCTWDYAVIHESLPENSVFRKDLAFATCPKQHTCRISSTVHSIGPDGMLSPSYVCPATGCDFHDYVQLVGWAKK